MDSINEEQEMKQHHTSNPTVKPVVQASNLVEAVFNHAKHAAARVCSTFSQNYNGIVLDRALGNQLAITFVRASPSVLLLSNQVVTHTQSGLTVGLDTVDYVMHVLNEDMSTRGAVFLFSGDMKEASHSALVRRVAKTLSNSDGSPSKVLNVNFQLRQTELCVDMTDRI